MTYDLFDGAARRQLDRLEKVVASLGLTFYEPPESPFGIGFGVAWSETRFVMVSVFFEEVVGMANIVGGVLRNVHNDRLAVLNVCNTQTSNNALFPFYLHDAAEGWDVLLAQRLPVDLLVRDPEFFGLCMQSIPTAVENALPAFVEAGVGGSRYTWAGLDLPRLLIRSLA